MASQETPHLPPNAFTRLKEGEEYVPLVPSSESIKEISVRSVFMGIIMVVLFSGAAAFLGLKIAQVFETAIPIAVIAIGFGAFAKRKSTILENVITQTIGSTSGHIVAGAIFTLPALYILGLDRFVNLPELFVASILGGIAGVFSIIPLRRYFVADMHGRLPFPEATAATGILVAGAKGGTHARILAYAAAIGGLYDFLSVAMHAWKDEFTTALIQLATPITDKFKLVFSINTGAAVMGLGYIIGLRYAMIIACGSFLSWFVFIPLFNYFGMAMQNVIPPNADISAIIPPASVPIAGMTANQIFSNYVRYIGIGGIFAAGLIGVIKSGPVIVAALYRGFRETFTSHRLHGHEKVVRTQRDISMPVLVVCSILLLALAWLFFRYIVLADSLNPVRISSIAITTVFILSFLFTTVAARSVAIMGINPISGMTIVALIVACLILVASGLSGQRGMLSALLIGGMVCTSLAMAGGFITDLKIGYWIGGTPRRQEWTKILGAIFSSITVAAVIVLLANVYGFVEGPSHPTPLPAPQANAMAAVIKGIMFSRDAPWLLYAIGAVVTILMQLLGVAPLAFALGMYIPLSLNTPLLAGAIIARLVQKTAGSDKALSDARNERGTLIASGLIAGGALMGIASALIKYIESEHDIRILHDFANDGASGNWLGLVMFMVLCVYVFLGAKKIKGEPNGEAKQAH